MCAVQIRGTDSLQLGVGGEGCVCERVCLCVISDVLRYLTNANERSAENNCGISCWFCIAKVTHCAALKSATYACCSWPVTHKYTQPKQTNRNQHLFLTFVFHPNLEISALPDPYHAGSFKLPASSNLKYSAQTVNSCLTCGTLVLPDTFNLKQNTLDWVTRPSADTRQNKTHCFLFQVCSISQAGLCLCACVHQALHHCLAAS